MMWKGWVMQMKNKSGLLIAAFAIVIMIGVICVMSVKRATERGYAFQIFDFFYGRSAELRNTIELSAAEVSSLKLEYGSKNIVVYPASDENITIKEYLYSDRPEALAAVTYLENNEVVVTGGRVQTVVFFSISGGERIEVYIPEKALTSLTLQAGSGNITGEQDCVTESGSFAVSAGSGNIKWNGAQAKEISFEAGSGNIKAADLKGNIRLQTGSGNISGDFLCGKLSASAGSGNITLAKFEGNGTMSANSGNVNVEAVSVTGDMEMQTGSGNIKLELPENLSFHLEVNTGSGNINTDFDDILSYNKKGNSAEGDVGNSPDISVQLKANSGNVKVLNNISRQ